MGFLDVILTPRAKQTVLAEPSLLPEAVVIIVVCLGMINLTWYISYVTGKPYRKPKVAKTAAKK